MKKSKEVKKKKTLLYATKFLYYGGAVGLFVIGILRFTAVNTATV